MTFYFLHCHSVPVPFHSTTHLFFFFNDTATTEIYTLSLHDALPILRGTPHSTPGTRELRTPYGGLIEDRKSTRLNSSHEWNSYAAFCLKKKKTTSDVIADNFKKDNPKQFKTSVTTP